MLVKNLYNLYYSIYYKCPYRLKRLFFPDHFLRPSIPYASHLPVIIGLARIIKIKRVLELGSGLFSSVAFLNKLAFPDLTELHSVENDGRWAQEVSSKITDLRFKYTVLDFSICSFLEQISLNDYDLIFIDDSSEVTDRAETISLASKMLAKDCFMVIHDYEVQQYRDSSKSIKNKFSFNLIYPNTAILWNDASIDRKRMSQLYQLIRRHKHEIPVEGTDNWALLFNSNFKASTI